MGLMREGYQEHFQAMRAMQGLIIDFRESAIDVVLGLIKRAIQVERQKLFDPAAHFLCIGHLARSPIRPDRQCESSFLA